MKLHFDDEGFDGQLQRTVGKCDSGITPYCCAARNRFLAAAQRGILYGVVRPELRACSVAGFHHSTCRADDELATGSPDLPLRWRIDR